MLKGKKDGSVLLIVLGLFAFVSIMITSIMMMTTGGYKLRKTQNTRVENFYGADSGIDISESITIELIEEAIKKGNEAVDISTVTTAEEKNKEFKRVYKKHIVSKFEKEVDNVNGSERHGISEPKYTDEDLEQYNAYDKNSQIVKVEAIEFYGSNKETEKIEMPSRKAIESDDINDIAAAVAVESMDVFHTVLKSDFKDKDNKDRSIEVAFEIDVP